jgi:hypothetical protein
MDTTDLSARPAAIREAFPDVPNTTWVYEVAGRILEACPDELVLADTTGVATPRYFHLSQTQPQRQGRPPLGGLGIAQRMG